MTENEHITRDQYLRLIGLMVLGSRYAKMLREIETSAADLLGVDIESREFGHISDAMWGDDFDTAAMLKRMGIAVPPVEPATSTEAER